MTKSSMALPIFQLVKRAVSWYSSFICIKNFSAREDFHNHYLIKHDTFFFFQRKNYLSSRKNLQHGAMSRNNPSLLIPALETHSSPLQPCLRCPAFHVALATGSWDFSYHSTPQIPLEGQQHEVHGICNIPEQIGRAQHKCPQDTGGKVN